MYNCQVVSLLKQNVEDILRVGIREKSTLEKLSARGLTLLKKLQLYYSKLLDRCFLSFVFSLLSLKSVLVCRGDSFSFRRGPHLTIV